MTVSILKKSNFTSKLISVICISVVSMVLFLPMSGASDVFLGPFSLDEEGFIRDWLIVGPFPSEGRWPTCSGFDKDYLENEGGENEIIPLIRMVHKTAFESPDVQWQGYHSPETRIDFYKMDYPLKEYIICYTACYLKSPEDRSVKLKIGSDDGYKIWLNHELIGKLHMHRGAQRDQNTYEVKLKEGINLLLIKVEQDFGGHDLFLRFTGFDNAPITDLEVFPNPPQYNALIECSKPDHVSAVDRNLVGHLEVGEGRTLLFPGIHQVKVELGSPQRKMGDVIVSLLDKDDKLVKEIYKTKTVLTFDKAVTMTFPLSIERGLGEIILEIKAIDSQGDAIGIIRRKYKVIDPYQIYDELQASLREIEKFKIQIGDLEESITKQIDNFKYVIELKENLMMEKDKEIRKLMEEIYNLQSPDEQ